MGSLRQDLTDLGVMSPELRPQIRKVLASLDMIAAPRYRDYVRRFKGPGSPMKQDEWEAKVLGKGKGKDDKPKETEEERKKRLDKHLSDRGFPKKPVKKWAPKVKEVMEKHDLTDEDAAEVKAFKSGKPAKGDKLSPQQLVAKFLQKAKPETKERMKGVSPADFMKMLGAIMDEEGEGGKMASLHAGLVKLGMTNPELRPYIRPLLKTALLTVQVPEPTVLGFLDPYLRVVGNKAAKLAGVEVTRADADPGVYEAVLRMGDEGETWTLNMGFNARGQFFAAVLHEGENVEDLQLAFPMVGDMPVNQVANKVAFLIRSVLVGL